MIYIIILLCISNLISIIYLLKEKKKEEERKRENSAQAEKIAAEIFEKLLATEKAKAEKELEEWKEVQRNIILSDLEKSKQMAALEKELAIKEIEAQKNQLDQLKENQVEILNEHKEKVETVIATELNEKLLFEIDQISEEIQAYLEAAGSLKDNASKELTEVINQLSEYKKKRDAINEEIIRQRKIEEQEDFYKINLDAASLHDLSLLDEIKPQFSKFDLIQKLEYDNYISKPAQEMVKRILNGKSPSGIYKITRLKTGEVYIGKSTNIKDRWIQHCKSCYHCGTISYSTFHKTLEKDGIQNFTWEVLEEVPKDKLTEREKYWIDFYDSKNYGMNEKVG